MTEENKRQEIYSITESISNLSKEIKNTIRGKFMETHLMPLLYS